MEYLQIHGNKQLNGEVFISGGKNAALPLIAATILSKNEVTITNVPNVVDVNAFLKLIEKLGGNFERKNGTVRINTNDAKNTEVTHSIARTIRASILVLGPLLTRFGHCKVNFPGGCQIGKRPVDLHLKALEQLGAKITTNEGFIEGKVDDIFNGRTIAFDQVTVGGTENIIMAAALAKGITTIKNAAKDPEVTQLCEVIKNAGVKIKGIGTSQIVIQGTYKKLLDMKDFRVIPDRIEAGTYMCAAAITNSKLKINNVVALHLEAIILKLQEMNFEILADGNSVTILQTNEVKPVHIVTSEYPDFPTDMQPQFMALATQANGKSTIKEKIFESRFRHVNELIKLGADIKLSKNIAIVNGKAGTLKGTGVNATDLRASAALVLAAMVSP